MGKTMSEKILAHASGQREVSAGDIVWARVDRAMMDDILGPRVEIAQHMKEIKDQVWDPEKVVIISDHYTPPASIHQAEIVKFTRDWAREHGIRQYFEFVGPCHQIMAEHGFIRPGSIVVGTDSHTCMGGALGAFATGIGSTEMMGVLIKGIIWLRVPETIRVIWEGRLPEYVMAKDISLKTIGTIGHAGATYKAVEYVGNGIRNLPVDERMAISNMAVEMGAKVGLMEPDDKIRKFLEEHGVREGVQKEDYALKSDEDAVFCETFSFHVRDLKPMVACPHQVDNVTEAVNVAGTPVNQAYIGSCTGGRYHDLLMAARLLNGRKVAKGVRLLVSPASDEIWRRADRDGLLHILAEAGAVVLGPTCGVCVGLHSGMIAAGENCISSSNRNFIGRMGSREAGIYLASPLTVAASALTGCITDPREVI
ncbi:MAG: 3-isopropylmalate dehydratase large subunit [Lachnospiraceae bacterium]|nr:3-isopropylmalate dehydratase large subunit [Lachnospiraceae bacterium]